jgi:hypothetical protein
MRAKLPSLNVCAAIIVLALIIAGLATIQPAIVGGMLVAVALFWAIITIADYWMN